MKLTKIAQVVSFICITGPSLAQQSAADKPQKVEKIEVTGSSIKRIAAEGALPLQIITKEDIERAGIVSAEQLIMQLSANGTGSDNLSSNMGIANNGVTDRNNNGNTSANLRGLGASSTLVLLNGRRISAHGAKGNAVDLNSIPLAAIQRVEVLKDGASAIYGTDAIGGVINFILKKDYEGVELTAFADMTHDGGGNIGRVSILAGMGDLAKDSYNVMASLTYDKQEVLNAKDRSFVNGFQPDRGLSPDTAGTPFATQTGGAGTGIGATFKTPDSGTQTFNRANLLSFQGKCDSIPQMSQYQSVLWANPGFKYACAFDYAGQQRLIQPIERTNFVSRATFNLNAEHTAFIEIIGSHTETAKQFEQSQITTSIASGNAYPVNGPYYQNLSTYIPTFDPTKPIAYRWRCVDCGKRTIETETDNYRVLAGLEGVLGKWDYKLGVSTAASKVDSVLTDGYMRTADFNAVLASGIVNPWLLPGQTQTPEAMAAIEKAKARGTRLFGGEATLVQFDGSISGELFTLPAGPIAVAAGFDVRKEGYKFSDGSTSTVAVRDAPFDAEFPKVTRDIKAIYGEAAIPITKSLELTAAVRHDDYSIFGGTTNPKVSIKFTPMAELLIRGSYNTGFRAPSFFQLYGATGQSQVPGNIADPVLCPLHPGDLAYCAIRPDSLQGGNKNLTPEESRQWTAGFVVAPLDWITGSVDFWQVKRTDRIYELTAQQVVANYTTFPENIVRNDDGTIKYIRAGFVNAEGDITKGVDVSLLANGKVASGKWTAGLDGTYINSFRSRVFATEAYKESVGQWNSRDLFVRWKHNARFTYTTGPWSATFSQNYTAGYKDEKPLGVIPPGFKEKVDSYIVYNLSATYSGFKNTSVTLGVKNLLNTDPPFTAHNVDFMAGAGWDPRVADPRGRAYTARITYKF